MSGDLPPEWDAVFYDIGGVIVNLPSIRGGYADYLQEFATEHGLDPDAALQTWRETLGAHFKSAEGTEYRTASEGYRPPVGNSPHSNPRITSIRIAYT